MTLTVVGANWDAAVLDALAAAPPPAAGDPDRQLHAARVLVDVIGPDLRNFLRCHGDAYVSHWRRSTDPIAAMVGWLADYYLHLHECTLAGPGALTNWTDAVRSAAALRPQTRLVATIQLGYALLVPLLLEEATGRAAYPIIHDQNPRVTRMYRERLRWGRPLMLTELTASDIRDWLDSDGVVVLNVDTSYPGTRQVRRVPFLHGELRVPAGLLSLACRRSLGVQAVVVPGFGGRVAAAVGAPLPTALDAALPALAAQCAGWVADCPEQWMGWASLSSVGR